MKRTFFILSFVMFFASSYAQMSAKKWISNISMGWCLGNTLEAFNDVDSTYEFTTEEQLKKNLDSETMWFNPKTTRAMIDSVKAAGFNAVRIPVRWYPHFIYKDGVMKIDEAWLARVHEIVDWCLADGMQVIINTHHEKWFDERCTYKDISELSPKFSALWTEIAKSFRDYDDRLAFAGTCEMHSADRDYITLETQEHHDVQSFYNQTFVDAVRATGGNNAKRNLLVQTFASEAYYNPSNFRLPNDVVSGHLIAEVHVYAPSLYCIVGKNKYFGPMYDDKKEIKELPAEYPRVLWSDWAPQMIVKSLEENLLNAGIPVVVAEFGAGRWNQVGASADDEMLQSRIYWYTNMLELCHKAGIAAFAWDNGKHEDPSVAYQIYFFDRKAGMKNVDPLVTSAMREVVRKKK